MRDHTMTSPSAQHLLSTLALLLLPACTATHRMLPICVQDERTRTTTPAIVDLYAVEGSMELRRQTITPVDEYFSTLGCPSRPSDIWRCILSASSRTATLLPERNSICRAWQGRQADTLIAITPQPKRRISSTADPRRITFPLDSSRYPSGTHSLIITLSDAGLTLHPSRERLVHPKPAH